MRSILTLAILTVAGGSLWAQEAQDGWKVVKDQQGACQLTVPSDWKSDKQSASLVRSPDGRMNAAPNVANAGESFAAVTSADKQMMPPLKIVENSQTRLWYSYAGRSPAGGANWYVAVAGSPVCRAQITFKSPSAEATARQIALSLTQAK